MKQNLEKNRFKFLRLLASPTSTDEAKEIGPNWFASVMGTGIIANASASLPLISEYLQSFALLVWIISAVMLFGLSFAMLIQAIARPHITRKHYNDPVMAQFYGAPPMAFMTVGGGALLIGDQVLGTELSVQVSWILWSIGTIGGLATAVIIPYFLFTRYQVRHDAAFGGWLMPIVPPMVSAAMGALLVPYAPAGVMRETMLYGCYSLFGLSLVAAFIIITMIWSRLAHHGSSGTVRVPTLWIVLGPLGQSITAVGLLGGVSISAVNPTLASAFDVFAILFGVPVWGFAMLWGVLAMLLTLRAWRLKMPFALTWWAFTFPVGTVVTGTNQLAKHTGLPVFEWATLLLYCLLLIAWLAAAFGTARGLRHGKLLKPVSAAAPVEAFKKP